MKKTPHPYIFMDDDMMICKNIKGFKVFLCGYISFACKLGQLLEVAICWKGVERLR
jgi:hypothetical protein